MTTRGKRVRIAEGIYRDAFGLAAVVKVRGRQKEKRFALGQQDKAERWRDTMRVRLKYLKRPESGQRGTLKADAPRYLAQVRHLASYEARSIEVYAWVNAFPRKRRDDLTRADVAQQRATWLADGTSPKTINNRCGTLRHWFHTLDGADAPTPVDGLTMLPVTKTPAIVVSDETVRAVDATLASFETAKRIRDRKTRARFRVLASTGKRPSELMRAQPQDIDLERRVWVVRDGKGGFSPGLFLNDDMWAAWALFIAADAWGEYNTGNFARTLRAAGWPEGVRPYNLRHTTWITASEKGIDLADIQAGAGHKHISTTRRHYVPVINSRMQRMSEAIDRRFNWGWTQPPLTQSLPSALPAVNKRNEDSSKETKSQARPRRKRKSA